MKRNIVIATLSLFLCVTTTQAGPFDFAKKLMGKMMSAVGVKNGSDYDNPKVMGQALAYLIHEKSTQADTIAKEISARFPNDAAMQTEIARAYFRNNSRETTRQYLDKAMAANNSYAPAYELKGLSYGRFDQNEKKYVLYREDADSACYWFDKAIEANPKEPSAYINYADAQAWNNIPAGVAKLEQLRVACPDYNVDMALADFYKKASERAKTAEDRVKWREEGNKKSENLDPYTMSRDQINDFASDAFVSQRFERAMELSLVAMKRFPDLKSSYRIAAGSAASLGKYAEAKEYGTKVMEMIPKDSLLSLDYWALGTGLLGNNNLDEAYMEFEKIKNTNDIYTDATKSWIFNTVTNIVDSYKDKGLYDEAAEFFIRYDKEYPSISDPAMRLYSISNIFIAEQKELEGEMKKDILRKKVFPIYEQIETEYPDWINVDAIRGQHARMLWSIFDPNNETLEPEPYFKKLYDHIEEMAKSDDSSRALKAEACGYLMRMAYAVHKDIKAAHLWANRLMELTDDAGELNAATLILQIKKLK